MLDDQNSAACIALALAERGSAIAERASLPQRMDEFTFASLYRETAPSLRSYIRKVTGDAALADDILQETFYRFLRAELPVMEKFQIKAYLYRTASSMISDHWRRLKRERRWSLGRIFGGETDGNAESHEELMSEFRRLKTQEQTLLWLAYVEGFDHREIAKALELKEKSVRVLLFRARKKLAGMLGEQNAGLREGA